MLSPDIYVYVYICTYILYLNSNLGGTYLSWSPLHRPRTGTVNGRQVGFSVFFITSVLCVTVKL